ncbi:hypothetical protein LguiB_030243 [Lonicera macranthoides]
MELPYPSFSLLFPFLLFLFILTKFVKSSKAKRATKNLPPGPRQLPLIGNMHQLLGSLTHHILRDLANKHGPLMFLRIGAVPTIVLSSPEIAEEVLKTHGINFAGRPYVLASRIISYNSINIAFSPYGDYWRQLRRICTIELLSTRRVQSFRSIREEEVLNLVKEISSNKGSKFNLSKAIFSLTFCITSRAAFGKKNKDQEAFALLVDQAFKALGGFSIADMYPTAKLLHVVTGVRPSLEKIQRKLDEILENIVVDHREKKVTTESREGELDEDLVDVLLRLQKQGGLEFPVTHDCIKAVILDIFTAGSETSSTSVEWAMSEMIKNPEIMERAQAEVRKVFDGKRNVDETALHELKYIQCVIKETLRLHPSAPLSVPRQNSDQCVINGYEIPARSKVIVNAWAIGRDPRYWPQAELFKPERFFDSSIDYKGTNFEYIPFGAGRRVCPGISFGIANIELPLAQLLYHFDWKVPDGLKQEELDMTEEFGLTVRRKNELYLIPAPYHSSLVEEHP